MRRVHDGLRMSGDLIFELGKDEFLDLGKCAFYDQGKPKFLWVLLGGHGYDQARHGSEFFCLDGKVQGHCDTYSVRGPEYAIEGQGTSKP